MPYQEMKNKTRKIARLFKRKNLMQTKKSAVATLLNISPIAQPIWTPKNYQALAKNGFMANPICYRCVRYIAENAAAIPWMVLADGNIVAQHPLYQILHKPNPIQAGRAFMEAVYSSLQIFGNAYIECVSLNGRPEELYLLRADRMKIVPGNDGWPQEYQYNANGKTIRFKQNYHNQKNQIKPILHLKLFNPINDYYGLSPLETAAAHIDVHNAATAWNKALLDNSARPSGALIYKSDDGNENLSTEQFERLKQELDEAYQGAVNAGRPLILEGGLEWKQMGYSPKDMDFNDTKNAAARDIALAFGIPPMLLGIPGDNTYAVFAEANKTFWRQTVIPLAENTAQNIAIWLANAWPENHINICCDKRNIPILAAEQNELWNRVNQVNFLSDDEKRHIIGYPPRETQNEIHPTKIHETKIHATKNERKISTI